MTRGALLLLAGALALGACTSGSSSPIERLRPLLEDRLLGGPLFEDDKPEPKAAPPITREVLAAVPFATISLATQDSQAPTYVVAVADNGGYVTFQDRVRRSVVMRGGLLTGTQGLGYNLASVKHQLDDPVVTLTPVADWPGQIARSYRFTLTDADDYEIAVRCRYQRVAREQIEVLEIFFDVERVQETCSNGARTFVNTYWAETDTGFVWKSEQWLGPRIPAFIVEIIRPYRA